MVGILKRKQLPIFGAHIFLKLELFEFKNLINIPYYVTKMKKSKFSLTYKVEPILKLVRKTDHKTLAVWAIDCVERVMPYFEEKYPEDPRPRNAIKTLQAWVRTGIFKMAVIRRAALDSHAAAREVNEDNAARSAARAAGQAVATAHVPTHSVGAASYALQAIYRSNTSDADAAVAKERAWQCQKLLARARERVRVFEHAQN